MTAAMALDGQTRVDSIVSAVDSYKARYPEARYQDYYKNFMQDFYGPGHLLNDTTAARRYLQSELSSATRFDGDLYEPTGYLGNYVRVNLSLLRDSVIDFPTFFDAFVTGMSAVTMPEPEVWADQWQLIDSVIMVRVPHYPGIEADRERIMELLRSGNYVAHHSRHFNDTYSLHYRIISSDIFEKRLFPLIGKSRNLSPLKSGGPGDD